MSFVRLGGIALFSSLFLTACLPPNMVNGGFVNPWVSPYPAPAPAPVSYVDVYKYQGSRQCENGGVPLAEMQRQLQMSGITVVNSSCGMDGRMYPAFCGGADGKINIFSIPSDTVGQVTPQGYMLLSDLQGAQRTSCYSGNNNSNANANNGSGATYPYTGGGNTSYYSYQ
jgi:hypothetical protein